MSCDAHRQVVAAMDELLEVGPFERTHVLLGMSLALRHPEWTLAAVYGAQDPDKVPFGTFDSDQEGVFKWVDAFVQSHPLKLEMPMDEQ